MRKVSGDILDLIDNALEDWSVSPDAMRRRPEGGNDERPVFFPAFPSAYGLMVSASEVQVGMMLLQRVAGGYEGRIYRLPPGASGSIPLADLEITRAGLYDENGTLIRELTP